MGVGWDERGVGLACPTPSLTTHPISASAPLQSAGLQVVAQLKEGGVKLIAMRCAGFDCVDIEACQVG